MCLLASVALLELCVRSFCSQLAKRIGGRKHSLALSKCLTTLLLIGALIAIHPLHSLQQVLSCASSFVSHLSLLFSSASSSYTLCWLRQPRKTIYCSIIRILQPQPPSHICAPFCSNRHCTNSLSHSPQVAVLTSAKMSFNSLFSFSSQTTNVKRLLGMNSGGSV